MKIATLNCNGESWNLVKRQLRISSSLKDDMCDNMTEYFIEKLSIVLEQEYEVIACQEMVSFIKHYNKIKEKVEEKGYKISPERKKGNHHIQTCFLVKNDVKNPSFRPGNIRNVWMDIGDVSIYNVHMKIEKDKNKPSKETENSIEDFLNEVKEAAKDDEKKVIVIGDFNSYSDLQYDEKGEASITNEFIPKVVKAGYIECGNDNDYTFFIGKSWRKLDHIFVSNKLNKYGNNCSKHNEVNIFSNSVDAFTDHSMLSIEME